VERILALHKQLAAAKTTHAQTVQEHQTDAADRQIDRLVYERRSALWRRERINHSSNTAVYSIIYWRKRPVGA